MLRVCLDRRTQGSNRVCSTSVEDRDRSSSVNQGAKCPITSLAVFQVYINSWSKDGRAALLPIRKETIHRARLADSDNDLVGVWGDELSHGAVAFLAQLPDLGHQVTRVVRCSNHLAVFNGDPHSCPAFQTWQRTLWFHMPLAPSMSHTTKVSHVRGDTP